MTRPLALTMTRRDFAPAAVATAFGAFCAAGWTADFTTRLAALFIGSATSNEARYPDTPVLMQSFRFESRAGLERAAKGIRARFPGAVLFDAIAAPHVPELIVVAAHGRRAEALPPFAHPVYEVRRYSADAAQASAFDGGATGPALRFTSAAGPVVVHGFASLAHRAAAWNREAARKPGYAPCEVGFYRVIGA